MSRDTLGESFMASGAVRQQNIASLSEVEGRNAEELLRFGWLGEVKLSARISSKVSSPSSERC